MNNFIILTDTRQQKEEHIIKEFDKHNILHIKTKLDSADYMALRYDNQKGFYKDHSTLIDTKKDLLELSSNLAHTCEHQRILREIQRAKDMGCENFIFLIQENKIRTVADINNWSSPHTKVKGATLLKIMKTMKERYDIHFVICKRADIGKYIIHFLSKTSNLTQS